jgi:nicotinamide mononucleotide transporter
MDTLRLLDILGFVVGIAYLILEYRASIWLWVAGVIMPAIDMVLYYKAGLYADFGMAIYYCIAGVYGFLLWQFQSPNKDQKTASKRSIQHFEKSRILPALAVFLLIWAGIWALLSHATNSTVPITDAFTTALSIVALWALAQKYAEQWLLWFVVDLVCCALYIYKGIPFKAAIYGIYTLFALFGYYKWCNLAKNNAKELRN